MIFRKIPLRASVRYRFLKRYIDFLMLFSIGTVLYLVGEVNLRSLLLFLEENVSFVSVGVPSLFFVIAFVVFAYMVYEAIQYSMSAEVTPEAKHTFNKLISARTDEIMNRAITIAQKRGEEVVTEDDMKEAIRQMEGD